MLYRGHSLVPNTITWNGRDCAVEKTFMNNQLLLDAGLRRAFTDMSGQRAGRLGPFNTPEPLLGLEARAIDQGRLAELAPYTDYREYVSLPRPQNFDDVSRDVRVVDFLRNTYERVEDIEFYVGLFAEDPVPNSPLPPLILRMVGVDAFSQALTNPLLSRYVYKEETFSAPGWKAIHSTARLRDIVDRNTRFDPSGDLHIGLTLGDWEPVVEGNAREG